jgi:hypothetical protein
MTLEQIRTAREMRMMKRLRQTSTNPTLSGEPSTVTSLTVYDDGQWKDVFVPGIDDPDDTELYIY